MLNSPYIAIGSFEQIADRIRNVRERTDVSYVGVFPTQMDTFAPIVPILRESNMADGPRPGWRPRTAPERLAPDPFRRVVQEYEC